MFMEVMQAINEDLEPPLYFQRVSILDNQKREGSFLIIIHAVQPSTSTREDAPGKSKSAVT